jgi:signal recognition particle receptor subunit beta
MQHKILFAGPVGAGKTTAIASVSDVPVAQTEARASDDVAARKQRTTVAMDYGRLRIDDQVSIQLVGTPGQPRFDFMWDILAEGAIGLVLLIDNARPAPFDDLAYYLNAFRKTIAEQGVAVAIGITRGDLAQYPSIVDYREFMRRNGHAFPVFEVDARRRDDIKLMLLALVATLDPSTRRAA